MYTLRQIGVVTFLSIRSLPQRIGMSLTIVIGIAGVVAILCGGIVMSTSLVRTIGNGGRADRAIVLMKNAGFEGGSSLTRAATQTLETSPGLRRSDGGRPLASAEALAIVAVTRITDGARAEVTARGVSPIAFAVRPELKLTAGRMFEPGVHELLVGRAANLRFQGLNVGDQVTVRGSPWTVVGTFEATGIHESELLADAETLMSAYGRQRYQSVTVVLENEAAFATFRDAVTTDPTLSVDVQREAEYFGKQSEQFDKIYSFIAYTIGAIMGIGAVFGALNTMYSAIAARTIEIATLRAIGFGSWSIVTSVLLEALFLALIGAAIGAALTWLLMNGQTVSTRYGQGQIVAQMQVTLPIVIVGVLWACVVGAIGGLLPAIRAARMQVATALRES